MSSLKYLLLVIRDEILAIKLIIKEQKYLLLLIAIGMTLAIYLIDPIAPKKIVLATAESGTGYDILGRQVAEYFKKYDVEVINVNTQGSAENLALLD